MKSLILALAFVTLSCNVFANRTRSCTKLTALTQHKRPAYEFSVRLLQRVTEDTYSHFVYAPLSTWMQLIALSEGATGTTFREIWNVTQHRRNRCFKKQLGDIMLNLNRALRKESKLKSVIAVDHLLAVRRSYIEKVEKLFGIKVLLLNFHQPSKSASEVNKAIEDGTAGLIDTIVDDDDFKSTVLLLSAANYFKSEWSSPFDSAYNKIEPFYSSQGVQIGQVTMMNQKGYFNMLDFPHIGAKVLELPFVKKGLSMLIFLPRDNTWVGEIFYDLQNTRLTSIFNMYKTEKQKFVDVSIPKFKLRDEIDNLPELIYDMGIKRIFNPQQAEFKGISKYKLYASLIKQITEIEVNEGGVAASVENWVKNDSELFVANKPFAYMIVDRSSEFILYAGTYSVPSVF